MWVSKTFFNTLIHLNLGILTVYGYKIFYLITGIGMFSYLGTNIYYVNRSLQNIDRMYENPKIQQMVFMRPEFVKPDKKVFLEG